VNILDLIDQTMRDVSVSGDAMRWQPPWVPEGRRTEALFVDGPRHGEVRTIEYHDRYVFPVPVMDTFQGFTDNAALADLTYQFDVYQFTYKVIGGRYIFGYVGRR
jgi:hypothetical protein